MKHWQTPLGIVTNNKEVTGAIAAAANLPVDEAKAAQEHSLENQLPLLQWMAECVAKDLPAFQWSIVPITVGSSPDGGDGLVAALTEVWDDSMILIATSDYTHAGPGYKDMPPDPKTVS